MATTGNKNLAFYIKRIIGMILLLSLAGVFFFSAISKMLTIDAFEWTFIDLGINSIDTAAILSRIFIGLELIIGGFLLFHIYLKSVTYPATIAMLAILTGYLILLIIKQGNTGNCGCFGDFIYMKPLQAIWKNLIMVAVVVALQYIYPVKPYKNQEWISALIGMGALVTSFIVSPLNFEHNPKTVNRGIDLNPLYVSTESQPHIDLRKGKHIVAFMSLTCPHCKKAAYMLHTIKRSNPDFSIYLILSGHPDQRADFFKESHAEDVPHILFTNKEAFRDMAGEYVPAIYWIKDSHIEKESSYYELNPVYMAKWLKN
jgi:glutaredoxin